ncbi:hypothetical protein MKEN_01454700 [Mycena kentingensis (nom. inval.)]|nr:hypothetical protein MKEN_01454700 [Mycena kentingensis (nom. inval.)]
MEAKSLCFSIPDCGASYSHQYKDPAGIQKSLEETCSGVAAPHGDEQALGHSLQASTFPVLTLPNELTSLIFIACLPNAGGVRPSAKRAPLVLLGICRHWRSVALHTPELWASLDLEICRGPRYTIALIAGSWDALRTWFLRANKRRLALTIHQSDCWDTRSYKSACWSQSFDRAFDVQNVWSLQADCSPSQFRAILSRATSLPTLRQLSGPLETNDLLDLFTRAPNLRSLRLRRIDTDAISHIQSSTLTSLDTGSSSITLSELMCIVAQCPVLEIVRVYSIKRSDSAHEPPPTTGSLFIPHLSSMHARDGISVQCWDALTLPRLHSLSVKLPPGATGHTLADFVSRSDCTVTHLDVHGDVTARATAEFIAQFGTLEVLEIDDGDTLITFFPDPNLVHTLAQLPLLHTIRVNLYHDPCVNGPGQIDYKQLYDFLALRENGTGATIKEVRVSIRGTPCEDWGSGWFPSALYTSKLRDLHAQLTVEISKRPDDHMVHEYESQTLCWPDDFDFEREVFLQDDIPSDEELEDE